MFLVFLAILAGFLTPTQICTNAELKIKLGTFLRATLFSFVSSAAVLFALLYMIGDTFSISNVLIKNYPIWIWSGGILGLLLLLLKVSCYANLGSVQTMVFMILGQVLTGLCIDHYCLFRSPHYPFTSTRIIGATLVILGAILTSLKKLTIYQQETHPHIYRINSIWILFAILSGITSASQTAVNGYLGTVLHTSLKASIWSFNSGSIFLFLFVSTEEKDIC